MNTPSSRLNEAVPCGVIRDGHQMTTVRLDDVKSLCGAVLIAETELASVRENCRIHESYANMMQEQRSQIAAYGHLLEKQIEALKPKSP